MASIASPTKYAGTATDTTGIPSAWALINNSKVLDSAFATYADGTGAAWSHGSGGGIALTNYGFAIPSAAVIDGIQVVVTHYGNRIATTSATLQGVTGGNFKNTNIGNSALTVAAGGPADLWGATITPAQINSSAFGVAFQSTITSSPSDALYAIDAAAIIVYYHLGGSTTPADVSTREYYKVRNQSGQFLGMLPVTEPFKVAQDINSLGSQVTIKVPVSADTAAQNVEAYTTEDLTSNYTNEAASDNYTTEGTAPIVSAAFQGIDSLIKNGNTVEMWLVNYWYPNGKRMFVGKIRRWEADFGGDGGDNNVAVVIYSSGYDLDNYITRGAPFSYTTDQSQQAYSNIDNAIQYAGGGGWHLDGQTFTVGAGQTNLGAIAIALNGTANVTLSVYDAVSGGNLLGQVRQAVSVGVATGILFGFPSLITVTPGQVLFFTVVPDPGQSIGVCFQTGNVYAGGTMYTSDYGGGGGGAYVVSSGNDLWFYSASGTPSTAATFSSADPTTGMIAPIITDYNLQGGSQVWTAASIDATGLSLTYRFNVQTIYEAMQAVLSLCPNGFYYYVDLGTQTIYFKNASTTADFLFIKGVHINTLKLINTTEGSINKLLFTGGEVTPGVNLYKQYLNTKSIQALGPLLDRKTDTRVTLTPTADAIGVSEIAELSGEQYQTTVTILHTKRLDITLLVPGKTVGFRGFGTFADLIIAQIVHREWVANGVVLTLGVLPKRLSIEFENTTRSLIASQTVDNPSAPS